MTNNPKTQRPGLKLDATPEVAASRPIPRPAPTPTRKGDIQRHQRLQQMLKRARDMAARNDRMAESEAKLYEIFKREIDTDTRIKASEFEQFTPLFDAELRKRNLERTLTVDEQMTIRDLSERLYRRVNVYRPIHVVDDITGKDIYVLPPIFTQLKPLHPKHAAVIDNLANANLLDDGVAAGPSSIRQLEAMNEVKNSLDQSQDIDDFRRQEHEFVRLASQFDHSDNSTGVGRVVRPLSPDEQAQLQVATTPNKAEAKTETVNDSTTADDIEFELD